MDICDIELGEKGKKEFGEMIAYAKKAVVSAMVNEFDDNCTKWVDWIESDSWSNYRDQLKHALEYDYASILEQDSYWAKNVRKLILKEHKEELLACLNLDLITQIETLQKDLNYANERHRSSFY